MDFQSAWLATKKFDRLVAHADDFAIVTIDCNNRWFVEENSFARLINESVDCAQIDSELVIEKLLNELHGDGSSSNNGRAQGSELMNFRAANCMPERKSGCLRGMSLEVLEKQ
jgi:hypothetical protein